LQNLQIIGSRAGRQHTDSSFSSDAKNLHKKPSGSRSQKERKQTGFRGGVRGNTKRILVIDDNYDCAFAIKSCLESYRRQDNGESKPKAKSYSKFHPFQVTVYTDPILALLEFNPRSYDLLLIDIDMPSIGGFDLGEKILRLDPNIKVCFMSAGEIHYEAIREGLLTDEDIDCFIKKIIPCTDLANRVLQELE